MDKQKLMMISLLIIQNLGEKKKKKRNENEEDDDNDPVNWKKPILIIPICNLNTGEDQAGELLWVWDWPELELDPVLKQNKYKLLANMDLIYK